MSRKTQSAKWAIGVDYEKSGVVYQCPEFGGTVELTCLYYLDVDQGSEGFLSVLCTRVRCSEGAGCPARKQGNCPLQTSYGDILNQLKVRVLQGERSLLLEDDGTVSETGTVRPNGQVIWFGNTRVS